MILGASFDSSAANAKFAKKNSFPFPLLCDEDRSLGLAYGVCASARAWWPSRISYWIGPDGRVRAAYANVSPPSHPIEVLRAIEGGGPPPGN